MGNREQDSWEILRTLMEKKAKLVGQDLQHTLSTNIDTSGRNLREIKDAITIEETRINTAQKWKQADRDPIQMNLLKVDATSLLLNELRNK